jgi:hypothetical protein
MFEFGTETIESLGEGCVVGKFSVGFCSDKKHAEFSKIKMKRSFFNILQS